MPSNGRGNQSVNVVRLVATDREDTVPHPPYRPSPVPRVPGQHWAGPSTEPVDCTGVYCSGWLSTEGLLVVLGVRLVQLVCSAVAVPQHLATPGPPLPTTESFLSSLLTISTFVSVAAGAVTNYTE